MWSSLGVWKLSGPLAPSAGGRECPKKGRESGLRCLLEGRRQLEGHVRGMAMAGSPALGAGKPGREGPEGERLWGRCVFRGPLWRLVGKAPTVYCTSPGKRWPLSQSEARNYQGWLWSHTVDPGYSLGPVLPGDIVRGHGKGARPKCQPQTPRAKLHAHLSSTGRWPWMWGRLLPPGEMGMRPGFPSTVTDAGCQPVLPRPLPGTWRAVLAHWSHVECRRESCPVPVDAGLSCWVPCGPGHL